MQRMNQLVPTEAHERQHTVQYGCSGRVARQRWPRHEQPNKQTHCREWLAGKPSNQNVVGWNLGLDIDLPDVSSNGSTGKVFPVQRYTAWCHLGREDALATKGLQAQREALGLKRRSKHVGAKR
jgi:hypothetical protein